jgi:hypothetical protein
MRNRNSQVRTTKRKLSKCNGVCRTYNAIQYAYADILEKDPSVISFECNVLLSDFEIEGEYTTDFVITNESGELAIRECVSRDLIGKPKNVKLMDASRRYWNRRGITDWGIVTNAKAWSDPV